MKEKIIYGRYEYIYIYIYIYIYMANRKLECYKVFMGSSLIAIAAALIAIIFFG